MDIRLKRQKLNALLAYGQMIDAKPHILESYGVSSTLDLSENELDELIIKVRQIIDSKNKHTSIEIRQWRHKCLCMIKECGIDTNNWNAVNEFMLDKRIAGKHLYELSSGELQSLHRKLHNVRDNKLKKAEEISRLTKAN